MCQFVPGFDNETKIEGYDKRDVELKWEAVKSIRLGTGLTEDQTKSLLALLGVTDLTSEKVGSIVSLWNKVKLYKGKPLLLSYEDPLFDFIGSAEESDPERLEEIVAVLRRHGVSIRRTEKAGDIAYGPSAIKGLPGNMKIADGASIAAWEHEFKHFLDDLELGYPGMSAYLGNVDLWINMERSAYEKEIEIALMKGYPELEKRYRTLLAAEEARWRI